MPDIFSININFDKKQEMKKEKKRVILYLFYGLGTAAAAVLSSSFLESIMYFVYRTVQGIIIIFSVVIHIIFLLLGINTSILCPISIKFHFHFYRCFWLPPPPPTSSFPSQSHLSNIVHEFETWAKENYIHKFWYCVHRSDWPDWLTSE